MNAKEIKSKISQYSIPLLLVILLVINIIVTPNFLALNTLNNIISQMTPIIFISMGMTLVISTGGIDISVGSVMALGAVVFALAMPHVGILLALLISVLISAISGVIAGYMVGVLNVQPMVATLGLLIGVRGISQVITDGRDIYFNQLGEVGEIVSNFGIARVFGLPIQIIPLVLIVVLMWILVNKTVIGRRIQAVGDNKQAAYLTGINTSAVIIFVYVLSAALAAGAGILQSARLTVAAGSSLGTGAELDAIASTVIGGTPMSGGRARVIGTVGGALIMQLITLTMVMNNIPEPYAQVLKAIILVFAVYIQQDK